MDDDLLRSFHAHMRERADRPFGDIQATSGQTLQPFSIAGQQAATNLLVKAHRALDEGDNNRARRFVDRAVALPYDEHECAAPVALATHMDLFCLVTERSNGPRPTTAAGSMPQKRCSTTSTRPAAATCATCWSPSTTTTR